MRDAISRELTIVVCGFCFVLCLLVACVGCTRNRRRSEVAESFAEISGKSTKERKELSLNFDLRNKANLNLEVLHLPPLNCTPRIVK